MEILLSRGLRRSFQRTLDNSSTGTLREPYLSKWPASSWPGSEPCGEIRARFQHSQQSSTAGAFFVWLVLPGFFGQDEFKGKLKGEMRIEAVNGSGDHPLAKVGFPHSSSLLFVSHEILT